MKQRFSSLDVKVIAHELNQSLVTLRLANVYDLSSKILLFKFAKPNDKKQLVIDTGFRCHLTKFSRTTAAVPSAFVARLRKFLRTRRLTAVAQIGTDRILEFSFSDGQYKLYLEFFASGNIILTDAELNILSLSRNVSEGDGQESQRVGLQYSLDNRQNFHGVPPLTRERVQEALRVVAEKTTTVPASKKPKGKPGGDLRKSLATSITELPPVLVEHVLQSNGFDTTANPNDILESQFLVDELVRLLSEAKALFKEITTSNQSSGYIFAKRRGVEERQTETATGAVPAANREDLIYEDFHPFVPHKLQKDTSIHVLEFKGYNATVDEFFSSLEGQRLETRLNEREAAAKRKLDAAKADQARRLEGLQEAQILNMRKAAAIESNVEWVQEATDAVNGLLAQGMDWLDIGKLIEREKKKGNLVANIIVLPLNLGKNTITLNLAEEEIEDEEADPFETDDDIEPEIEEKNSAQGADRKTRSVEALRVDVNLALSPWSNAREYYDQRRTAVVKEERTQQQAARALKNAEQKITQDLKKGLKQEKALLQAIRKQAWFEKFLWFISSDGHLVLGGKDAQQNETLYKKHLRKGDVYCHADLRGAPSVIIKNNQSTPDAPIPPATLAQAGSLSVCASEAWDQKAGMGAWWVKADQVSKSAPTGEFLPTGSFMVRDNKNFLPPTQLLLGIGVLFKISEESKARHFKHRVLDTDAALASGEGTTQPSDLQSHSPRSVADANADNGQQDEATSRERGDEIDNDGAGDDGDEEYDERDVGRDNPLHGTGSRSVQDDDVHEATDALSLEVEESIAADVDVDGEEDVGNESGGDRSKLATQISTSPVKWSNPSAAQTGSAAAAGQPAKKAATGPRKRGQKGKAKKIAAKYKDQDDEDRAAAEALIGATTGQRRIEAEAEAKAQRQAELDAAKERRRAQHRREQKEIAVHEEMRRVLMDKGTEMLEPDEAEQVSVALDSFVGTPLPGDELLEAIPICAPWTALAKLKYKAKLQPGPMKKGKAIKEVMERWRADAGKRGALDEGARDPSKMWPREVELIKALKMEEMTNCVPASKVRLMMGVGGGGGGGGKKGGQKGRGKGGRS